MVAACSSLARPDLFLHWFAHDRRTAAESARSDCALSAASGGNGRNQRHRPQRDLGASPALGDVWHSGLGRNYGPLAAKWSAHERARLRRWDRYGPLEIAVGRIDQQG